MICSVWTRVNCTGGNPSKKYYFISNGSEGNLPDENVGFKCVDASTNAAIRCCADVF